jgi:thiamine biosynthesis lipoprotein ApbE
MVYATKENNEEINRVARLSCLSRKQVVQAMSNERKRLKAEGSTVEELKGIKEAGRLSMQLKELQKSLKQYVKEVTRLMVCNSSRSYISCR